MKAKGNGEIKTCVGNLLRIFRGENPYERLKGLDPRMIDKPTESVKGTAVQDAWWLLETYEPRANIENITAEPTNSPSGVMLITAEITGEGEATNG